MACSSMAHTQQDEKDKGNKDRRRRHGGRHKPISQLGRAHQEARGGPLPRQGRESGLFTAIFQVIQETFGMFNGLIAGALDYKEIDAASRIVNLHEATAKVVKLYIDRIRRHIANEERVIDVWVLSSPKSSSNAASQQQSASGCQWKEAIRQKAKEPIGSAAPGGIGRPPIRKYFPTTCRISIGKLRPLA